jgi:hypothetical protein
MTEFYDPPDADLADDIFIRLETGETVSLLEFKDRQKVVERGGPGSGHHRHEGRPGEVGGSLPRDAMGSLFAEHEKASLPKIEKLVDSGQDILTDEQAARWNPLSYNHFEMSYENATDDLILALRMFYQRTGIALEGMTISDDWRLFAQEMLEAEGVDIRNVEQFANDHRDAHINSLGGAYLPTEDFIFINTDKNSIASDKGAETVWHEVAHRIEDEFNMSIGEIVEPQNDYFSRMVFEHGYEGDEIDAEYIADLITSHVRGPVAGQYVFWRRDEPRPLTDRQNKDRKTVIKRLLEWSVPYMESMMLEEIAVQRARMSGRLKYVMRPEGWVEGLWVDDEIIERGGKGSGHHGHKGRPGEIGGSLPSGERRERLENRPPPTGNCFQCAAQWVMDEGKELGDDVRLVHGTVAGQGPLEGIRFTHAWVEFGDMVYDADKEALMRRGRFYELGKVRDTIEYDPTELRVNLLKHEHWGPWHEKFDDGPWVEKRAPLDIRWIEKGGPGSGYHAPHFGRPGVRGGSRPRHEGMGLTKESVDNVSIYTSDPKTAGIVKEAMELMQTELGITLPKMTVTDNNEWFAARERKYLNKYRELVDERLDQYETAMRNLMLDAPGEPEEITPLQHEMEDFHVGRWRYLAELDNQDLLEELNHSVGGSYGKGKGIVWLNSETLASPGSKGFNYTLWHEVGHAINHEVSGEEFSFLTKGYRGFGRDRNGVPWKYSDRVGPRGAYERRNSLGYERDRVPDEYFADLTAAYMGNALYGHGYKFGRRFGWRPLETTEQADLERVVAHMRGEESPEESPEVPPLTERVSAG